MSGLFGSTALEVIVALVFVYFLLSLICSTIQETLAAFLKLRAHDLERGIKNLLCDPQLASTVLNHPLIKAMGSTRAETVAVRTAAGEEEPRRSWLSRLLMRDGYAGKPSYIPARTFALALFESLAPATEGPITVKRIRDGAAKLARPVAPGKDASQLIKDLKQKLQRDATFAADLLAEERKATTRDPNLAALGVVEIRDIVGGLVDAPLQPAVKSARTLDAVREALVARRGGRFSRRPPAVNTKVQERRDALRDFVDAVQLERAKQAIGRAVLSLIDESRGRGTFLLAVDDVKAIVDRLTLDGNQEVRDAVAQQRPGTLDQLYDAVASLKQSPARDHVLRLIEAGQTDLQRLQRSVESWYDHAMERVSGVYKRRTQWWLLVIATLVSLLLGADTLRMVETFSTNPAARAVIVNEAERVVAAGGQLASTATPAAQSPAATPDATAPAVVGGQPTATAAPTAPTPPAADGAPATPAGGAATATPTAGPGVAAVLAELQRLPLPFGYGDRPGPKPAADGQPPPQGWQGIDWARWPGYLARKALGLAVTAFALALGAPFWFDLLQKVVRLRATGPPPETTAAPSNQGASTSASPR